MARGPVAMVEGPRSGGGANGFALHAVRMLLVLAPFLLMALAVSRGMAPRMPREVLAMVVTMEVVAWQQW